MPLITDQLRQKNYKKYEPELQLKQDISKQLFSDPQDIWDIKPTCEGDNLTSGNESDPEETPGANKLIQNNSKPKLLPQELYYHKNSRLKKNVRFGDGPCPCDIDIFDVLSQENDYFDYESYVQHGRRMIYPNVEADVEPKRPADDGFHFRFRKSVTLEPQTCLHRPRSSPVKVRPDFQPELHCRMKTGPKKCSCNAREIYRSKPSLPYYEDDYNCYDEEENRRPRDHVHQIYHTSVYQNPCLKEDPSCYEDEYEYIFPGKGKKKVLHNYEEMPAVDEQQECFSDSTYKIPYSKYVDMRSSNNKISKKKSDGMMEDSPAEWIYHPKKTIPTDLNKKLPQEIYSPKVLKMRSRRTRLNRIKEGWKRAVVHTIRDGSRKERVGLIVLGPKGPEFYSRASRKSQGYIPFRKTRSFPEGPTESYDTSINPDCDKIFASSSEPGARTFMKSDDPLPLEKITKIEDEISEFSKNVDQIVKSTEDKFLKNLSKDDSKVVPPTKPSTNNNNILKKTETETSQSDEKEKKTVEELLKMEYPPFHLIPFDKLSPKAPKEIKNKESSESNKTIAQSLNEQAKHYKTNHKDKGKSDPDGKHPNRKKSNESIQQQSNLTLWGMKSENLKETNDHGDFRKNSQEKSKLHIDDGSQAGSVKSNEQININKQRRKKYFESTTSKTLSTFYRAGGADPNPKKFEENSETGSELKNEDKNGKTMSSAFHDLVNNGCAISEKESENLQNLLRRLEENQSGGESSSGSSEKIREDDEVTRKAEDTENDSNFRDKRKFRNRFRKEGHARGDWTDDYNGKSQRKSFESYEDGFSKSVNKKVSKLKEFKDVSDEVKARKKPGRKSAEGRITKLENKMKFLREALPSLAAENEATHLKQLKKYIHHFIERVEHRNSSSSETKPNKKIKSKVKDSSSTDSSEVKVDAKRIIDIVSHPFKKIASDMTINIAKTLTDVLVQESSTKSPKNISTSTKLHKDTENETEENSLPYCTTMGSDRCEETEPTYLKKIKKMRKNHINNIIMETKRLDELLRFLDRCYRFKL